MACYIALFTFVQLVLSELADNEYIALTNIIDSTAGNYWIYPNGAIQWNFNSNQDPCVFNWVIKLVYSFELVSYLFYYCRLD